MEIKLIGTDIDGVWTDSKMYYTDQGDYMKAFSTYDGMAVQLLREKNIENFKQLEASQLEQKQIRIKKDS